MLKPMIALRHMLQAGFGLEELLHARPPPGRALARDNACSVGRGRPAGGTSGAIAEVRPAAGWVEHLLPPWRQGWARAAARWRTAVPRRAACRGHPARLASHAVAEVRPSAAVVEDLLPARRQEGARHGTIWAGHGAVWTRSTVVTWATPRGSIAAPLIIPISIIVTATVIVAVAASVPGVASATVAIPVVVPAAVAVAVAVAVFAVATGGAVRVLASVAPVALAHSEVAAHLSETGLALVRALCRHMSRLAACEAVSIARPHGAQCPLFGALSA